VERPRTTAVAPLLRHRTGIFPVTATAAVGILTRYRRGRRSDRSERRRRERQATVLVATAWEAWSASRPPQSTATGSPEPIIVDAPVRKQDPESDAGKGGRTFRARRRIPTFRPPWPTSAHPGAACEHGFILDHIALHSLRRTEHGWTWKFDPSVFLRASPRSPRDYLADVRCRVALMRGEFSAIVPPETGEYMYELLNRNSPLVEIPQAHHHLMLDQRWRSSRASSPARRLGALGASPATDTP